MRGLYFGGRVTRELLRDPLSYIFCLLTPMGMQLMFFIIWSNVPEAGRANVEIFRTDTLAPGIAYFGFSFVMLFGSLLLSRDRSTAFLTRLYATPMTAADFLLGYALPLFVLGIGQMVLTFSFAAILGAVGGTPLSFAGVLRSAIALLPSLTFFVGVGLLFGALLSENAAPGLVSVVITLSGVLGGVWMPLETMPKLERVFSALPFLHGVRLARGAYRGGAEHFGLHLAVSLGSAALAASLAVFAMHLARKRETR